MLGSGDPTVCYVEVLLTLESPPAGGHSGWEQSIHIDCT